MSAYTELPISESGNVPRSGVFPLLEDGNYTLTFRVSDQNGAVTTTSTRQISVGTAPGIARIEACMESAPHDPTRSFQVGESVFVRAKNLPSGKQVDIYVIDGQMDLTPGTNLIDRSGWYQTMDTPIDNRGLRGTYETVTTSAEGEISATGIWSSINAEAGDKRFEIVVDVNRNGVYDEAIDARQDAVVGGFVVRPQVQGSSGDREALISADIHGNRRQNFASNEPIYVRSPQGATVGQGYEAVRINVCADHTWADGEKITAWRKSYQTVCSDDMLFLPTYMLEPPHTLGTKVDVVLDMVPTGAGQADRQYNLGVDYIQGASSVGAEIESAIPKRKWTIILYMEANNDLESDAFDDLNELESLPWIDGTGHGDVNCVGLVTTSGAQMEKAGCYVLAQDDDPSTVTIRPKQIYSAGLNMGDPQNLSTLIDRTKTSYPADRYALVIWNHGSGFRNRAICHGPWGAMPVDECANAIRNMGGVDLLVLDACYMAGLETLSEFTDVADVVVASENTVPGSGMRYDNSIAPLIATPDMSAEQLGQSFVNAFAGEYGTGSTGAATLARFRGGTGADSAVLSAVDSLARAFIDDRNGSQSGGIYLEEKDIRKDLIGLRSQIQSARTILGNSSVEPDYESFKDLESIARKIKGAFNDSKVQAACDAIISTAASWRLASFLGQDCQDQSGTSLWFPNRSDFKSLLPDLKLLKLAKQTQWDEFLKALYSEPLYRIEMSNSHPLWNLYPFFSDTFWEESGMAYPNHEEIDSLEGYVRAFSWTVPQATKNWEVSEAAADKTYKLWVGYDDVPTDWEVDNGWVTSGPITVKVYKRDVEQPIHTLTGQLRCRAGTYYQFWRVLSFNPQTGAITIIDDYPSVGF